MASTITFRPTEEQGGFIDGMIESGRFCQSERGHPSGNTITPGTTVESKLTQLRQLVSEGENSPIINDWSAENFVGRMRKDTVPEHPTFYVREKADSDLEEILSTVSSSLALLVREQYVYAIEQIFKDLAANPKLGRRFDPDVSHYFQYPVESHVIFYASIDTGVEIFRNSPSKYAPISSSLNAGI